MLTRLEVDGFKNLIDVDVRFGPLTCVAGPNGVGKSNLFDAIGFLSALADRPFVDAARAVRAESGRGTDLASLFHRAGTERAKEMHLAAEMIIPAEGADDLGQQARAAITFVRYELTLALEDDRHGARLVARRESLSHINLSGAWRHLRFPHRKAWRDSIVHGRRASPLISTSAADDGTVYVTLHQDLGKGELGGGGPRMHVAHKLPRTVLSHASAAENATAVLTRREMQSWRRLQLEPAALRAPDTFAAASSLAANGAHLPATLSRLTRRGAGSPTEEEQATAVYARIAHRLNDLGLGIRGLRVVADAGRELLTLRLLDAEGAEHEAGVLSGGTLRFLALAVLECDAEAGGLVCLEEPENGIHPDRMPALLDLLGDVAVDPTRPVADDNPLRQVIVNTHSPAVVREAPFDSVLIAVASPVPGDPLRVAPPRFRWLDGTWRVKADPEVAPVSPETAAIYIDPLVHLRSDYPRSRRRAAAAPAAEAPQMSLPY